MGSNGSKPNNEMSTSIVIQKTDADVCDNPDPRSPTPEVSRTPLHVSYVIIVYKMYHGLQPSVELLVDVSR